jgi:hypothetical protein
MQAKNFRASDVKLSELCHAARAAAFGAPGSPQLIRMAKTPPRVA